MTSKTKIVSCLVVLTSVTLSLFFLAQKNIIAYANNYDFIRHSACYGLWSYIPEKDIYAGNYQYPALELYADKKPLPNSCVQSSENITPLIITQLVNAGSYLPIQILGLTKYLLLIVPFLVLFKLSDYALFTSLFFAWITTEWVHLAYASTFYAEFTVITAFLLCLCAFYNLLSKKTSPWISTLILAIALLVLGLSKLQWAIFTALLGFIFCFILLITQHTKRYLLHCLLILATSLSTPFILSAMNSKDDPAQQSIQLANKVNTYFAAVLPASDNLERALDVVNLPSSCQSQIGKNWFHTTHEETLEHCPQLQDASRLKLLKLFLLEPKTFYEPLILFLTETHQFYPHYLGNINPEQTLASEKKRTFYQTISASTALNKLPTAVLLVIITLSTLTGLLYYPILLVRSLYRKKPLPPYVHLLFIGSFTCFYSAFSSIFGDGYIEAARHSVLLLSGFYLQIMSVVFIVSQAYLKHLNSTKADHYANRY